MKRTHCYGPESNFPPAPPSSPMVRYRGPKEITTRGRNLRLAHTKADFGDSGHLNSERNLHHKFMENAGRGANICFPLKKIPNLG